MNTRAMPAEEDTDMDRRTSPGRLPGHTWIVVVAAVLFLLIGISGASGAPVYRASPMMRVPGRLTGTRPIPVIGTQVSFTQQKEGRGGSVDNARPVDAAVVNVMRSAARKRALVAIIVTLLGGLLVVAFVPLKRMRRRGVEDPQALEEMGLPVHAAIPFSSRQQHLESAPERWFQGVAADENQRRRPRHSRLLALNDPADLAMEAVRSLRTSLHFAMLGTRNNIVMMSGASSGVGTTFVATNLAAVLARAGERVVLVDGDMHGGTVHRVMGCVPGSGLSELLSARAELSAVIHRVPLDNLHFVSRGETLSDPSESLMRARFARLLEDLSQRYDRVIVDAPPILMGPDAAIVGRQAGTCLLVARPGLHQAHEIALVQRRFEQYGVELKGAIFNAVQERAAGYYADGSYEYDGPG